MKSLNVVLFIAAIAVTIPQTNAFGDTHEAPENWHYVNAINTHSLADDLPIDDSFWETWSDPRENTCRADFDESLADIDSDTRKPRRAVKKALRVFLKCRINSDRAMRASLKDMYRSVKQPYTQEDYAANASACWDIENYPDGSKDNWSMESPWVVGEAAANNDKFHECRRTCAEFSLRKPGTVGGATTKCCGEAQIGTQSAKHPGDAQGRYFYRTYHSGHEDYQEYNPFRCK